MIFLIQLCLWFMSFIYIISGLNVSGSNESGARNFLQLLNEKSVEIASKLVTAQWDFETNNTEITKKNLFQMMTEAKNHGKTTFSTVLKNYLWEPYKNYDIKRQLRLYSEIGMLALSTEKYEQFQKIISDVDLVQEDTTICDYYNKTKCDLHLYPDIQEQLKVSHNSRELLHLWMEWRKASQPKLKELLINYVKLTNNAAFLNNYQNFQEYSLRNFQKNHLKEEMISLWNSIKPLYSQIHAYVRKKLRDIYGTIVPLKGPIPAHLLGSIWSENWLGIADKMVPYLELDSFNFTSVMINEGYNTDTIHKLAEDLFLSMNFSIPRHLWFTNTLKVSNEKPKKCRSKIFNFYHQNIRIKDCVEVSMKNYLTAHRLLTKALYMLQYSNQPYVYQAPADPGLEEAFSNIITMSASTFSYLKKINLLKNEISRELRLNKLFKLALEKIVPIPFLMVQEFWRWEIYNGKAPDETSSTLYILQKKYQGISTFTKELSFDPGGTGSVFSVLSLTHHFYSKFLEFQMYESFCNVSNFSEQKNIDFDECDLYGNIKAGVSLRKIMSLGSSKSLLESLNLVFDSNKISSKAILKYFEPLMDWLTKENKKNGEFIGWDVSEEDKIPAVINSRRKRSLEEYPLKDADMPVYNKQNRFKRSLNKRFKDKSEMISRNRKDTEYEEDENENMYVNSKNNIAVNEEAEEEEEEEEEEKKDKDFKEAEGRSIYSKKRSSEIKNNKNTKENSKDLSAEEEKVNDNLQKTNKFTTRNKRHHSDSGDETNSKSKNKEERKYQKRRDDSETNKKNENTLSGQNNNINNPESGKNNKILRYARKARKKQRRFANDVSSQGHNVYPSKDKNQYENDRSSRNAQWHTDTKKDISRLLHSFGFAVENDDKEKLKELKKKLKGDSNSDLKSNMALKENTYENIIDYNRLKSGDSRSDTEEEKEPNKFWSVKSYMTGNTNSFHSNPALKDGSSDSQLRTSVVSRTSEEKTIGKKETTHNNEAGSASLKEGVIDSSEGSFAQSGESSVRHLNIELPTFQILLKNDDLAQYGQKPFYTIIPSLTENKAKNDLNSKMGMKSNLNKYSSSIYKYSPNNDLFQYNNKKEYREDADIGGKSPYVIILGQLPPELKEHLMQKNSAVFESKHSQLQSSIAGDEKKASDKKARASEEIYIVPIDLKNSETLKSNYYAEHENENGFNLNAERDQEFEDKQVRLDDTANLNDRNYYHRNEKGNPAEFVVSWNNDKNRKVVKRSEREHDKESEDEKLKVVRLAPMKQSVLEGLLGKNFDQANLDNKNVKILVHNGLLREGADYNSGVAVNSPMSSSGSSGSDTPIIHKSQSSAIQPSSSLSSLASNVLSVLSPKSYSQVAKASEQHQDSTWEEENLKETEGTRVAGKDQKEQETPYLYNSGLRCNALTGKKKGAKLYSDDDTKKLAESDSAAKGDDSCCKKIILTPCPPRCPPPCPSPCPLPCPPPCPPCGSPCPPPCPGECPPPCCKPECDICCKKPSECSLVNCQFKITKAKKPHERLTIMIYDRINPPAELPEPYDALAVISEILQRIQCCSCKPSCQLTEEDPDYPANDNMEQLKGLSNQQQENKGKVQEISGEIPILEGENAEEEETDENGQSVQNVPNSADDDKYQPKEKATPAIDQLTVFNKDKLKPVFIELRKIDNMIKKRSQKE